MRPRVPEALRRFIWDIQSMVELADGPREILFIGRDLMRRLVTDAGWLPAELAAMGPGPCLYQLYHDEMERFSIVASVLGPQQSWPCFDDGTWEIRGVLQGAVQCRQPGGAEPRLLQAGAVETSLGQVPVAIAHAGGEPAVVIQVFGSAVCAAPRRVVAQDGTVGEQLTAPANPVDAPAYDILSIQAEVTD